MTTGYSGKPLIEKLGIKTGYKMLILNNPENYLTLLDKLPERLVISYELPGTSQDFIHFFTAQRQELEQLFPVLKQALAPGGMLWISWPKAAAKMRSDLTENIVREIGLANGLVDVKVCAIDATWSGLKFVYRIQDRHS